MTRCRRGLRWLLRAEKVEQLGFFLSQHLANHISLAIRDVAIGEKLLIERNIFLADKYIEGHHNAPPPCYQYELDHIRKKVGGIGR